MNKKNQQPLTDIEKINKKCIENMIDSFPETQRLKNNINIFLKNNKLIRKEEERKKRNTSIFNNSKEILFIIGAIATIIGAIAFFL